MLSSQVYLMMNPAFINTQTHTHSHTQSPLRMIMCASFSEERNFLLSLSLSLSFFLSFFISSSIVLSSDNSRPLTRSSAQRHSTVICHLFFHSPLFLPRA